MRWITTVLIFVILSSSASFARGEEAKDYHVTVFGAMMTDGALPESAFLTASFDRDFKFAAVTAAKKVGNLFDRIDIELEGQAVKHMEGQHHWEFNALVVARWLRFPWNNIVKTSFAVGEGLSLAMETPAFEEKYHGPETNPLLNYLMFELDFALPAHPRWSLVTRLHHRSGIYGFFSGVDGASNALALGIRYHF